MSYIKITDDHTIKTSELFERCKKAYPSWSYWDDLDKDFPQPKKSTTRWFLDTQEPDEELENKSANDLEKEGIEGITIREYLILSLDYFERTGEHMDVKNWTLCSGSRSSDGRVPGAGWRAGMFHVDWCDPSYRGGGLRSRRALASDPSTLTLEPSPVSKPRKETERQALTRIADALEIIAQKS